MSTVVIGFVGAVIGGLLAGGASLAAVLITGRQARAAEMVRQRSNAYSVFIAAIYVIMLTVDGARFLGTERSGAREIGMLLTGTRRPMAPEEILDLLIRGSEPLSRGWSLVWAVGSPESVRLANQVMDQVNRLTKVATTFHEGRGPLFIAVRGVVWTTMQKEQYAAEVRDLGALRKEFTELTRRETGQPAAQLWSENESVSGECGP